MVFHQIRQILFPTASARPHKTCFIAARMKESGMTKTFQHFIDTIRKNFPGFRIAQTPAPAVWLHQRHCLRELVFNHMFSTVFS